MGAKLWSASTTAFSLGRRVLPTAIVIFSMGSGTAAAILATRKVELQRKGKVPEEKGGDVHRSRRRRPADEDCDSGRCGVEPRQRRGHCIVSTIAGGLLALDFCRCWSSSSCICCDFAGTGAERGANFRAKNPEGTSAAAERGALDRRAPQARAGA